MSAEPKKARAVSYDELIKTALVKFYPDLIELIYKERPLEVQTVKTDLAITAKRLSDELYRVQFKDRDPLLTHIEFQLGGEPRMSKRMLQYVSMILDTPILWKNSEEQQGLFRREIDFDCTVVYLIEKLYSRDPGFFVLKGQRGFEVLIRYRVIKLWQMDPTPIFQMESPGLLPFTPLMAGNPEQLVLKSCKKIAKTPNTLAGPETKRELLTILAGLAGLVIKDKQLIPKLISEIRAMSENLVFDFIRDEGKVEGRMEGKVEGKVEGLQEGALKEIRLGIIKVLKRRFGELPADLPRRIETLDRLQHLEDLLVEAAVRPTLGEFLEMLQGD